MPKQNEDSRVGTNSFRYQKSSKQETAESQGAMNSQPNDEKADNQTQSSNGRSNEGDSLFPPNFETEDPVEIIPPRETPERQHSQKKSKIRKREFNPWAELDKASKKNVTRRDLITGLFRFLPREHDKK